MSTDIEWGNWKPSQAPLQDTWSLYDATYKQDMAVRNFVTSHEDLISTYDRRNDAIKTAIGADLPNPIRLYESTGLKARAKLSQEKMIADYEQQLRDLAVANPQHAAIIRADETPFAETAKKRQALEAKTAELSEAAGMVSGKDLGAIGKVPLVGSAAAFVRNAAVAPKATMAALAGGLHAQFSDPVEAGLNLLGFAPTRATHSLLKAALINSASGAAVEAGMAPYRQMKRKEFGLEYGWEHALGDIDSAAALGAILDLGVRAPGRAALKRFGTDGPAGTWFAKEGRGGLVSDYVDTSVPPKPVSRETVTPTDIDAALKQAEAGDTVALEAVARKTGIIEDPAIRGMINHVKTVGYIDAKMVEKFKAEGIDYGEGITMLNNAMAARYARVPDPVAKAAAGLDMDGVAELAAKQAALGEALAKAPEDVAGVIRAGAETGLPEIVAAARAALRGDLDGIAKAFADAGGLEQVRDRVTIHASLDPLAVATAMRRNPGLVDTNVSLETDWMQRARAIAALDELAFEAVSRGIYAPPVAALVADMVPPGRQLAVLDMLKDAGTLAEARQVIEDLNLGDTPTPSRLDAGATVDDPAGPQAKAQIETLEKQLAPELEAATAPMRARDELDSKLEGLRGKIAKEDDPAKRGPMEAEAREIEVQLASAKDAVERSPASAAAYRLIVERAAMQRVDDVRRAIGDALALGARIAPADTKFDVRTDGMRDPASGNTIDAVSDSVTGDIALAAYALNPAARMGHEVLHTLVTRGLIAPNEVALLAKLARERGVFTPDMEAQYRKAYAERDGLDALLDEEAAAQSIEARINGEDLGAPNSIADRVKQVIERIRNALQGYGFRTADDVMDAFLSGEMAQRQAVEGWARQAAQVDADTGRSMKDALYALRSTQDDLGYYSHLDEVLKTFRPTDTVTKDTLLKRGVKQAELDARGLGNAFDNGGVRVGELKPGEAVRLNEVIRPDLDRDAVKTLRGIFPDISDAELARDARQNPTKWSRHSLDPSNPSYRETVLHLPETAPPLRYDIVPHPTRDGQFALRGKDGRYQTTTNGSEPQFYSSRDYAQNAAQTDARLSAQMNTSGDNFNFRSGHFPEPNIIGHMMSSLNKHEGKNVYTLDQIQSDWGQKLRDGGVRDEAKIAGLKQAAEDAANQFTAALDEGRAAIGKPDEGYWGVVDALKNTTDPAKLAIGHKVADAHSRSMLVNAEWNTANASASGHPLVNTTDQWSNTTLRRAIRQAAEADADFIAIPSGDTVLSYNPGDADGMRGFYGSRTSEGIVPKNLRKLLEKIDKDSAKPAIVDQLETPTAGMKGRGFTLFPLSAKVKQAVKEQGQPLFALAAAEAERAATREPVGLLAADMAAIDRMGSLKDLIEACRG